MLRLIFGLVSLSSVLACPDHNINLQSSQINKRADGTQDWAYDASYNWAMINPNYTLCQIGTQQSPIQLMTTQGLSQNHIPKFNYSRPINGALYNWGFGPAFSLNSTEITTHPSLTFDDETIFLKGWHIHSPAEHIVQGDRSKAELHLVHADATGKERGVVAIRIDPGNVESVFFQQFIKTTPAATPRSDSASTGGTSTPKSSSSFPDFRSKEQVPMQINAEPALKEVNMFSDFWTYRGSLTSPPCTEGIRFWVARNVLFVSHAQMQEILAVSTYSARVEQEVWRHQINV